MTKLLISLSMIGMIIACSPKDKTPVSGDDTEAGQNIFKKYCVICHGADGKLGINGAKDISVSTLTVEERVALITKGKNTMTPFEGILTADEVRAVAAYTMTLKQE
ncbi:MAG: cytochrome c [Bacteroidota bacterium]|nr:cytochrome c [Bacteroidota bacterium]